MKAQSTDKRKILITVPSLGNGGGISRYVLLLCKIFKDYYSITILTTHAPQDDSFAITELSKISRDIKYFGISANNKFLKYLKAIIIIRSIKPDFIINNYDGLIQFVLPWIKQDAKFIHVLHNDTDDFYRIGNINAKYIDAWIAPTSGIADKFNNYTNSRHKDKVSVISHGVDDPITSNAEKSDKLKILFTGVLYEHKGVKELPLIIRRLNEKNVELHFTIIGTGILEDWLKEEFKNEIETGMVTFTGVIDHSLVYKHMAQADIFLYPTHIDAFGLVIAEAMMNGAVPVVSLLKGVTDNLIDNDKNGYLIQQGDIESFVNAVESLYSNRLLLKELSSQAHEQAISKFSLSSMAKSYIQFIENI